MDIGNRSTPDTERSLKDIGDSNRHNGKDVGDTDAAIVVISRADAKRLGLKRYFTGEPCSKGHVVERGTASRACLNCLSINQKRHFDKPDTKEKRKAYQGRSDILLRKAELSRERYKNSPDVRLKEKVRWTKRSADPACKERNKELRKAPHRRAKAAFRQKEKMLSDSEYRKKQLEIMSVAQRRSWVRKQVENAAKILTETLGIPHTVVKMEDGTFQPVPVTP